MSSASTITVGVLLLALVTVESGGVFLERLIRGKVPANELQRTFFRAGHAHAAVLVLLGIVVLSVVDRSALTGGWDIVARYGIPAAAVLMPAGFFLSVIGRSPAAPNRFIVLLWAGVVSLTAGLLAAGAGLIAGGVSALG